MRWPSLIALALLAACRAAPSPTRAPEPTARAEPVSVRPGVNDSYFEDGSLEKFVERFEGERREVVSFRDRILAALELRPGMVVADVGAGTGLFFAGFAKAVGPEGRVYATDLVPAFLERLRARTRAEGLVNVEVVQATPLEPRLPLRGIDLVFMCDVYHHIEFPAQYMAAVGEAMKPDARLVVVDFERIEGVTSKPMMAHVRAGKETVLDELRGAGFELVREVELPFEENYLLILRRAG